MFPRIFEIPLGFARIPINSYGVMVLAGFLAGLWVMGRRARARGLPPEMMSDLSVWILLGGLIGARIVYVVFYNRGEFHFGIFNVADGGLHPLGALAGLAAGVFAWRRGRRDPPPVGNGGGAGAAGSLRVAPPLRKMGFRTAMKGVALLLLAGLLGARVLHVIVHRGQYDFKLFAIWEGGIVFYGGFVTALAAALVFLRRRNVPVLASLDIVAPSAALGMVFGRLGCFLKGCCYGGVSYAPWAVAFPRIVEAAGRDGRPEITGSPAYLDHLDRHLLLPGAAQSLPVHATQLYESAAMLGLFFLLSWYWRRSPLPGRVLAALGAGYGLWRFAVEFLRGDPHPRAFGLNFSQMVSVGVVAASALLWIGLAACRGTRGDGCPEKRKSA